LKTCIEQEYDGDYEIVLSDNSVEGHNVAYETYKKLNSDKIKYYKTPRDFNLTKSYEYAYLQTKGKYIISIGADDALLPWALSILDAEGKLTPEFLAFSEEKRKTFVDDCKKVDEKAFRADVDVKIFKDEVL
jgi:glycosyltransferase involved in cell wall biosynthesis